MVATSSRPDLKQITARFNGKCRKCAKTISEGSQMLWGKDAGGYHVYCAQVTVYGEAEVYRPCPDCGHRTCLCDRRESIFVEDHPQDLNPFSTTQQIVSMVSRYDGKCSSCGIRFAAGTDIQYDRTNRKAYCSNPSQCWHNQNKAEEVHEAPVPATPAETFGIPVGYFTVVEGDGSYTTLRIQPHWDETEAGKGVKVASYLSGADNESSYTRFGFVDPNGQVRVWGKHRSSEAIKHKAEALKVILGQKSALMAAGEAYALESGKCFRCNRKLTVPSSISAGLGPDCAKLMGW